VIAYRLTGPIVLNDRLSGEIAARVDTDERVAIRDCGEVRIAVAGLPIDERRRIECVIGNVDRRPIRREFPLKPNRERERCGISPTNDANCSRPVSVSR
jgi:hypothetical protein